MLHMITTLHKCIMTDRQIDSIRYFHESFESIIKPRYLRIFHFKVCVGVSHGVKNSNPRHEGHILLPGTKDYKV